MQSAKELHSTSGPVRSLPLLCIADEEHPLRDTPVCSPVQRDLHFFANEQRTTVYPPRADFMDGCTLCGFTLATGEYVTHKKLGATVRGFFWIGSRQGFRSLECNVVDNLRWRLLVGLKRAL